MTTGKRDCGMNTRSELFRAALFKKLSSSSEARD